MTFNALPTKQHQFNECCKQLAARNSHWIITTHGEHILISRSISTIEQLVNATEMDTLVIEEVDPACLEANTEQHLKWDINLYFDIVWGPTLYFNITSSTGILRHKGILEVIAAGRFHDPSERPFEMVIGQSDHPLLHVPYFYIHPCKNQDIISGGLDYRTLLLWISTMQQVLGIDLVTLKDCE
jgi:Autophagocytosis associated protein, active-site domain